MAARLYDAAKLQRDWANAWRRTKREFSERGIHPSSPTQAAAVVLELWLRGRGPVVPKTTREDLMDWLDDIYSGRCGAHVSEDGDVAPWPAQRKSK